jgi:hypothetical protein
MPLVSAAPCPVPHDPHCPLLPAAAKQGQTARRPFPSLRATARTLVTAPTDHDRASLGILAAERVILGVVRRTFIGAPDRRHGSPGMPLSTSSNELNATAPHHSGALRSLALLKSCLLSPTKMGQF